MKQTDCPGSGICAINQPWSGRPGGWCMCNTFVGLTGAQCNDICSQGAMILAMSCINTILGLSSGSVCLYFGCYTIKRTTWANPVIVTMIFSGLGSFLFVAFSIVGMVNSVGFRTFATLSVVNGRELRRSPQSLDSSVFSLYACAACLGACAFFVLPLAWVR